MKTMTIADLKNYNFKSNKYSNNKTNYKGDSYDSKKEADYAEMLDMAMYARGDHDKVLKWERQVKYSLDVKGGHICNYFLDFKIYYKDRIDHVDVKGYRAGPAYSMFKLKKKMMKAIHGIDIIEV